MGPASWYRCRPTRVRRNYHGGAALERREGRPFRDGERPEDWIASVTPARNPGLAPEPGEGLTRLLGSDGEALTLGALLAAHGEAVLGPSHLRRHGPELGFLAKLLDAGMRLHVQAHPTATFAQEHLGSRYGKLETYVILSVREGSSGCIRLGFQRPPSRREWRRIIAEQDIAAMDACFDEIPVRPGEVWLVPGGMPHAIGAGVLMLEVMEPSDLVVRCEFEREGIVVPPPARFMGRDLDFCLQIFDYDAYDIDGVRRRCRIAPETVSEGAGWSEERLIGPGQTDCFGLRRLRLDAGADRRLDGGGLTLLLVEEGRLALRDGHVTAQLGPLDVVLLPACSHGVLLHADLDARVILVDRGG